MAIDPQVAQDAEEAAARVIATRNSAQSPAKIQERMDRRKNAYKEESSE